MTGPTDQPPPEQVQLQPWGWDFPLVGETAAGKVMAVLIRRQLGEVITLPALVADMKRFHEALGDAIKEHGSGIVVARGPLPLPPNGHR
jgi:hypothetical protein